MNDLSISTIQKQTRANMTSRIEASLTAPDVTAAKENEMLANLKREIRDAEYAFKLMEDLQKRFQAALNNLEG